MKKLIVMIAVASIATFSLQAETPAANATAQKASAVETNATAENNETNTTIDKNTPQP